MTHVYAEFWRPLPSEILIEHQVDHERGQCSDCGQGLTRDAALDDEDFEMNREDLYACSVGLCDAMCCSDCIYECVYCKELFCDACANVIEHVCDPICHNEALLNFIPADIATTTPTTPVAQSFFHHRLFDRNLVKAILKFL